MAVKRTLVLSLAVFVLIVLLGAGAVAWDRLMGSSEGTDPSAEGQAGAATPGTPEIPVTVWNGRDVQSLDATFFFSGQQFSVGKIIFAGLDKPRANVALTVTATLPSGTKATWLTSAFRLEGPNQRIQSQPVRLFQSGRKVRVEVRFSKVPSKQLLDSRLGLVIRYPVVSDTPAYSGVTLGLFPQRPIETLPAEDSATTATTTG